MTRIRGVAAAILAVPLALVFVGCGDGGDTGGDDRQALTAEPVGGAQAAGADAYDESVDEITELLDEYWAETLTEEFDVEYSSPSDVVAYDTGDATPTCGGEPPFPQNAFYCAGNDIVAWDESGLMIPFYEEVGDAAVGFVIAHEWGHLIQNRLEAEFPLTIEAELNADCLGGTFAGALQDEGLLEGGESLEPGTDLYEAAVGIYDFGDAPDVHWQDPDAHGQPKQRLDAFETGYEGGAQACAEELGPGFTEGA
jgi:predicted metalloprotease